MAPDSTDALKRLRKELRKLPVNEGSNSPVEGDVLKFVAHFLQDHGFSKASSAFRKESGKRGYTIEDDAPAEESATLPDLWHAYYLQNRRYPGKSTSHKDADEDASSSDEETSSDEEEDEGEESERDEAEGALVDVEAEETSDDDSDEKSEEDPDQDSDEESSDEESGSEASSAGPAQPPQNKRKRIATPPSDEESSSEEDSSSEESSSEESDARPAKRTKIAKLASGSESSSSESDDEEDAKVEDTGKGDGNDDESSDDSSDESSSSSESESASSEDDGALPVKKVKAVKVVSTVQVPPQPKQVVETKDASSLSSATLDDEPAADNASAGNVHPDRLKHMPAIDREAAASKKKSQVPFSRIPTDQKVDPRFASNEYVPYDYAERAYRDLVVTKGKGFTKEKNKKKRGAYRGGAIDVTPKGIRFDD